MIVEKLKKSIRMFVLVISVVCLTACSQETSIADQIPKEENDSDPDMQNRQNAGEAERENPVLLYQGHASLRITTPEGYVIFVDPYEKITEGYEESADLILVTDMRHRDHNHLESVKKRNTDCQILSPENMITEEGHATVDLGYISVEAVEAGYNELHDPEYCVGYILEFLNGVSVYISGDTGITPQMETFPQRDLDYAFFCCDGIYTMTARQASEAAGIVQAEHSIPYHTSVEKLFDREIAEEFEAAGRIILDTGEELILENENRNEEIEMKKYDFSVFPNVKITGADLTGFTEGELEILYQQARYCQAMTDADIDMLRELTAEDITYTHMSGMQQTREEYFADVEDGSLRYYTIGIDCPQIEVKGDRASLTFTSVLNANAYGARGTFRMPGTHWYEKREGIWILV